MAPDEWIEACKADEIEQEDVIRFDHSDHSFAIYRTDRNEYYATDGFVHMGSFIYQRVCHGKHH